MFNFKGYFLLLWGKKETISSISYCTHYAHKMAGILHWSLQNYDIETLCNPPFCLLACSGRKFGKSKNIRYWTNISGKYATVRHPSIRIKTFPSLSQNGCVHNWSKRNCWKSGHTHTVMPFRRNRSTIENRSWKQQS